MGGVEEIFTARHKSYPLHGVVDDNRQMIAREHLLSRQNDIAEELGLHLLVPGLAVRSLAVFVKTQ